MSLLTFNNSLDFFKWFQDNDCLFGLSIQPKNNLDKLNYVPTTINDRPTDQKLYAQKGPPLYLFTNSKKVRSYYLYWLLGYTYQEYIGMEKKISDRLKIYYWIEHDCSVDKAKEICEYLFNNYSEYLKEFFPKTFHKAKHPEYWVVRGHSIEYGIEQLRLFQEDVSNKISSKIKERKESGYNFYEDSPLRIEYWLKRFDTEEANRKFDEYKQNSRQYSIWCKEYWLKRGYSEEEAETEISKIQGRNTKEEFLKRHGANFEVRYAQYKETLRNSFETTLNYWLNQGYSEEEARLKQSDRQRTFTLEKCIEKYGQVNGYKVWKQRQDKWQKTLSLRSDEEKQETKRKQNLLNLEHQINLHGLEKGTANYEKTKIRLSYLGCQNCSKSKESRDFFQKLELMCLRSGLFTEMLYYENEHIIQKTDNMLDGFYSMDFFAPELKIAIEYNTQISHPKEGQTDWLNRKGEHKYEEAIETDRKRQRRYKELGYTSFIVWNDEIKTDETLTNKLKFLVEEFRKIYEKN